VRRLTVKEFSRLTGLSRATVYRYIKQGKLRAERIDGVLYVIQPETEVETGETEAETARDSTAIEFLRGENERLRREVSQLRGRLSQLETENENLRQRVRELEADKAYLQDRIVTLEELLKSLTPKALPKPPLRERIRRIFKRSKQRGMKDT